MGFDFIRPAVDTKKPKDVRIYEMIKSRDGPFGPLLLLGP